jgi:hypothetical protein
MRLGAINSGNTVHSGFVGHRISRDLEDCLLINFTTTHVVQASKAVVCAGRTLSLGANMKMRPLLSLETRPS